MKKTCVICRKKIEGGGNNAQPVKEGECCSECNFKFVVPARLKRHFGEQKDGKRD